MEFSDQICIKMIIKGIRNVGIINKIVSSGVVKEIKRKDNSEYSDQICIKKIMKWTKFAVLLWK